MICEIRSSYWFRFWFINPDLFERHIVVTFWAGEMMGFVLGFYSNFPRFFRISFPLCHHLPGCGSKERAFYQSTYSILLLHAMPIVFGLKLFIERIKITFNNFTHLLRKLLLQFLVQQTPEERTNVPSTQPASRSHYIYPCRVVGGGNWRQRRVF